MGEKGTKHACGHGEGGGGALNGSMAPPSGPYRLCVVGQIFLAGKLVCQRTRNLSDRVSAFRVSHAAY
jgi:hypothetical protein